MQREGFPLDSHNGHRLVEGVWHFRDLRSPDSAKIGEAWFAELLRCTHHARRLAPAAISHL